MSYGLRMDLPERHATKCARALTQALDDDIRALLEHGWTLDQLELVYHPYPDCVTTVRVKI